MTKLRTERPLLVDVSTAPKGDRPPLLPAAAFTLTDGTDVATFFAVGGGYYCRTAKRMYRLNLFEFVSACGEADATLDEIARNQVNGKGGHVGH